MADIMAKKSIAELVTAAGEGEGEEGHGLKRCLGPINLITLGQGVGPPPPGRIASLITGRPRISHALNLRGFDMKPNGRVSTRATKK